MKISGTPVCYTMLALLCCTSCGVMPVFSSLEQAKTLGTSNADIGLNYSSYTSGDENQSNTTNSNLGFRAGLGLNDLTDLKLRYERLTPSDTKLFDEFGVDYFSLVQKFRLTTERPVVLLAKQDVYLRLSEEFDPIEFGLGFGGLYSFRLTDRMDISPSLHYTYLLDSQQHLTAGNLGIGADSERGWMIRGEIGLLKNVEGLDEGWASQFSIGMSYTFRR